MIFKTWLNPKSFRNLFSSQKCRILPDNYEVCDRKYDVVVVGAGISGLRAALLLKQKGFEVACISKTHPTRSNSVTAMSGINASLGNFQKDCWTWHHFDTVKGGDFLGDQSLIHHMTKQAEQVIEDLENMGTPFSRFENGSIFQRKLGGQALRSGEAAYRACACSDSTGHSVHQILYGQALRWNVEFLSTYFVLDLLMQEEKCVGVIAWNFENGTFHRFAANSTILATGGYSQIYPNAGSCDGCTGDGTAFVSRAGLPLQDMEFIQFHPTGVYGTNVVISEAARSEGGFLLNRYKERFMPCEAVTFQELAPADIVCRAIVEQLNKGRGIGEKKDHILLDLTHIPKQVILDKIPSVLKSSKLFANVDVVKEGIPVAPIPHYTIGGIPVNFNGQVLGQKLGCELTIEKLYAVGEVASTTVHGANKLAGQSLLESLVFAKSAADHIARSIKPKTAIEDLDKQIGYESLNNFNNLRYADGMWTVGQLKHCMQRIVQRYAGLTRTAEGLQKGLGHLNKYCFFLENIKISDCSLIWNTDLMEALELQHILINAIQALNAMLHREESRGVHFRLDFPNKIDEYDHSIPISCQEERLNNEHFRKHILTWINCETAEVDFGYRRVNDDTLDKLECPSVSPTRRLY